MSDGGKRHKEGVDVKMIVTCYLSDDCRHEVSQWPSADGFRYTLPTDSCTKAHGAVQAFAFCPLAFSQSHPEI